MENLSGALLDDFFPDDIALEASCEPHDTCSVDMVAFKGLVHRWLAATTQVAPFTASKILSVLETSAQAAVDQCTGGKSGRKCGFFWSDGEYVEPETSGAGEQMSVLSAVSNLLISNDDSPATSSSRGGSSGDSNEDEDGNGDAEGSPSSTESEPAASSTPTDSSMAGHAGVSISALALVTSGWMAWSWIGVEY